MALVAVPATAVAPQNDLIDRSQPYIDPIVVPILPLQAWLASKQYDAPIQTENGYATAIKAVNVPPRPWEPLVPPSSTYCSCVLYAKAVLGRTESWGNAAYIQPSTQHPSVGAVILLTDGGGHVGVVTAIGKKTVTFTEANYSPCQKDTRTLPLDSNTIKGYKTF